MPQVDIDTIKNLPCPDFAETGGPEHDDALREVASLAKKYIEAVGMRREELQSRMDDLWEHLIPRSPSHATR